MTFQYTDRENDGTGLLHYRFRYYSPEMQRFISEDPIRLWGGINYYSAFKNNPINKTDPLGLWSVSIGGYYGWGGGIVFGRNPGGDTFISFRAGYGIGGGVSFNPRGTSPGYDPCNKPKLFGVGVGGYGEGSVGLGPAYAGVSGNAGVNVEYQRANPYAGAGPEYGLDWGWSLRGGAAAGIEITFQ